MPINFRNGFAPLFGEMNGYFLAYYFFPSFCFIFSITSMGNRGSPSQRGLLFMNPLIISPVPENVLMGVVSICFIATPLVLKWRLNGFISSPSFSRWGLFGIFSMSLWFPSFYLQVL